MLHCLNPPLAGANGIEILVDPFDRLVPNHTRASQGQSHVSSKITAAKADEPAVMAAARLPVQCGLLHD